MVLPVVFILPMDVDLSPEFAFGEPGRGVQVGVSVIGEDRPAPRFELPAATLSLGKLIPKRDGLLCLSPAQAATHARGNFAQFAVTSRVPLRCRDDLW